MNSKKVIIAYASAGAGHFKAAYAVYDYLKKERPDLNAQLVDILQNSNIFFRGSYIFGYPFLVKHLRWLWGILFWLTGIGFLQRFIRGVVSFVNRLSTCAFANFLRAENPDYIISTHFLTSEIAARLKSKGKINSFVVTAITDFGVHPFWVSKGTDLYLAASEATGELLLERGIPAQNINCCGIPVNTAFLERYDRKKLLSSLGLKNDKFNVLIVTGSFGIGPIEKIIKALHNQVQVLAVCARNQKLYKRLKTARYENCRVFGFVDNMQELMAIADIIITKPGGMSTYESLVTGLVPVFISPIPGQEQENIRVLAARGIAVYPKGIKNLRSAVLELKDNPQKLAQMKEDIAAFIKPYCLRDISDVIR